MDKNTNLIENIPTLLKGCFTINGSFRSISREEMIIHFRRNLSPVPPCYQKDVTCVTLYITGYERAQHQIGNCPPPSPPKHFFLKLTYWHKCNQDPNIHSIRIFRDFVNYFKSCDSISENVFKIDDNHRNIVDIILLERGYLQGKWWPN